MFADDAFRIARLQRRFTERPEFSHEHRNERVAQDVVREMAHPLLAMRASEGISLRQRSKEMGQPTGLEPRTQARGKNYFFAGGSAGFLAGTGAVTGGDGARGRGIPRLA